MEVPGTLLFDHPSIGGIASMLGRELEAAGPVSASPGLDRQAMVDVVGSCAAAVLGTRVSLDAPLMEAGIDSLGASEVTRALGEALGVEVPGTLLFDHPSIGSIASMLGREVAAAGPVSASPGLHQSVFTKPETRPPQPRIA